MNKKVGYLGIVIMVLAVISLVIGIVFLQQGFSKQSWMLKAMADEKITFDID
jgi:hypothetical protein